MLKLFLKNNFPSLDYFIFINGIKLYHDFLFFLQKKTPLNRGVL
ncbi:hypothetical protein LVDJXP189_510023 [Flavobacterium psychrophilum]|nr:hypothetical protein LVDJXP189_510023 [Flavobacterium psychrophilum]